MACHVVISLSKNQTVRWFDYTYLKDYENDDDGMTWWKAKNFDRYTTNTNTTKTFRLFAWGWKLDVLCVINQLKKAKMMNKERSKIKKKLTWNMFCRRHNLRTRNITNIMCMICDTILHVCHVILHHQKLFASSFSSVDNDIWIHVNGIM